MKTAVILLLIIGCTAFVYVYPAHWPLALALAGSLGLLSLALSFRDRIKDKGGFSLWLALMRLRLRPAFTRKAKNAKARDLEGVNAAIEKVHSQRRRQTDEAIHSVLRREVRKIGAVMARLSETYGDCSFVDFHFMDDGACIRITDDLPYPHEDIYAIQASVQDHRMFRRKVLYCVRKGQMLEDKEVFPAHVPAKQFASLNKAGKVLNKELRTVIGKIASRGNRSR